MTPERGVEPLGMRSLTDSLAAVEAAVVGLDRPVARLLRPGVLGGAAASILALRKLSATAEYVTLYEWHDGTDTTTGEALGDLWLVPGFYLPSLADALVNYDAFVGSDRWDASWFPVLANGGGDFLALELSPEGASAPVRHVRFEEDDHPIEYESLTTMFVTFAAAYEQRIFFVDSRGTLEVDDRAFSSLAATLNPTVPWWMAA